MHADLATFQRDFAAAILSGAESEFDCWPGFAVYRNNSAMAAIEALAGAYPTVRKILGEFGFRKLALDHFRSAPPENPVLASYDERFATRRDMETLSARFPYLSDIARIDRMQIESHLAHDPAEAAGLDVAKIADADWATIVATLHPGTRFRWFATPAPLAWLAFRQHRIEDVASPPRGVSGILLTRPFGAVEAMAIDRIEYLLLDGLAQGGSVAGQFVDAIESAPPSKGYEPLFIGHGDEHLTARFLALVIVTVGPKYADENSRQRPAIATAIRNLGKKGTRRTRSVVRACETILSMPVAHSLIDCIFMEAGHRDLSNEFANLLERAVVADPEACRRLIEIARTIADDIPPPRGKKISLATAMHQLLLEMLRSREEEIAYTWNDDQEDFVDAVTQATRREVGDPDFDPRPARRRMRARQRRTTGNQLARRERRPAARKPSRI